MISIGSVFVFYTRQTVKLVILLILAIALSGCGTHYSATHESRAFKYQSLHQLSLIPYMIDSMTLEEKIAQQFILGFEGLAYNDELARFNRMKIGGVLLFSRNIQSAGQTKLLNEAIADNHNGIPMFIAVDQEGGRVNRLPKEIANTETPYQISSTGSRSYAHERGAYIGHQLKSLGFNMDFAPSFDIWSNPSNTVIGDRSFGKTAQDVIRYAIPFNKGINEKSIITSAKHFPGHGDTFVDSHESLPVSSIDKKGLFDKELKPFQAAIDNNIDMMMVSHILYTDIDATHPASMSRKMIHDLLQQQLSYKGVVITDDLAMGAIAKRYSREQALLNALNAGETMLLIGSDIGDVSAQIKFLKAQVDAGKIDEKIINENVEKILKLKHKYGIV